MHVFVGDGRGCIVHARAQGGAAYPAGGPVSIDRDATFAAVLTIPVTKVRLHLAGISPCQMAHRRLRSLSRVHETHA